MNEPIEALAGPAAAAPAVQFYSVSTEEAVRIATEHFEAGRRAQAESVCLEILAAHPEQPDALHICGAIAHLASKTALALALMEKAARLSPLNPAIRYNLGVAQMSVQLNDAAILSYRSALQLMPQHFGALHNLGNLLLSRDAFEEARRCYETALALNPNHAPLQLSIALYYATQRDIERAQQHMDRARALDPEHPVIRWEAAQLAILRGDFENGWPLYEARFPAGAECKVWQYPYPQPRWQGEPLAGRHLLIHGEQGLGDEIMFLSIVPELLREGARITLIGQPHLAALWRTVFPQCRHFVQTRAGEDAWTKIVPQWIDELNAEPIDYQIPFGSLALIRRRSASAFAAFRPFIKADPMRSAAEKMWLDETLRAAPPHRLRVGLVWAGNPSPKNVIAHRKDAKRSLALSEFAGLLSREDVAWVFLQTWEAAAQVRAVKLSALHVDAAERLRDFSDTAALIEQLDLVITVDTSVCHLAAAMGKPVWILLPFLGEWRWGLDSDRSLWWPTARLFRQSKAGDWAGVLAQVAAALDQFVAGS